MDTITRKDEAMLRLLDALTLVGVDARIVNGTPMTLRVDVTAEGAQRVADILCDWAR